ncbi:MAG: hypothetical protein ABWX61_04620 [Paenisporosarcina sp.]
MQKYWLLIASITLSISMLAACNTSDGTNSGQGNTSSDIEEVDQKETTTPEEDSEEADTSSEDDNATEVTADSETGTIERGPEKSLSFNIKGEAKEETATLTKSDGQNYSLYKLDGFELTGEEPNKDSLYLAENDAVFMRIETISKDDASIEIIQKNMLDTMEAVSISSEPAQILEESRLPQGNGISNPVASEVKAELGTVTGIVFEQGNLIVRLTIFDRNTESMTDAFLKMGETIAVNE